MSVFRRVVLANDEVRDVRREIVLVYASKLGRLRCDISLLWRNQLALDVLDYMSLQGENCTHPLLWWDAGAAEHNSFERYRRVKKVNSITRRARQ